MVYVDKGVVTSALRRQGHHDRAQQAECVLPRHVDVDRDAGLLHQFLVDLHDLEAVTGGDSHAAEAEATGHAATGHAATGHAATGDDPVG